MSILSRLFGGGAKSAPETAEPEVYKDFTITPTPIAEGGQFRLSAVIAKEVNGTLKEHTLIRADLLASRDAAIEAAIRKGKQMSIAYLDENWIVEGDDAPDVLAQILERCP